MGKPTASASSNWHIITGRSKEILENEVKPLVAAFLKERGLQLSKSKTRITHISEGFDFLGLHIRKYNGKFLTKPSRANVQSFLAEIKTTIRKNLHTSVEELLRQINPKIRGWALFHRSSASKEIFNYVDYRIFYELEHWIRRRHPWCVLRREGNLVRDQMEQSIPERPSAAGAYCEGDTGSETAS